ncbi:CBL-interacting serine/threonine-protein kinase 4-like [Prosopis cineraria]|uniref:CBL-interacting serine/threonine-protein kinase 4-like n=1 Tax=Prosopis cineraria TaxID=364024 RepID=UPI00240F75BE|nr:CBL-interacting serine/threonine-protein kinase 4-like [Prosopis cineraria]
MEPGVTPPTLPSPSPDTGAVIFGKYQLTNFLGRGSFAKVYCGRSLADGSIVAVKIINKQTIKASMESRIVSEVNAMCRLHHHPNILKIYEVMATKTKIYLIIEYAAGGDLCSEIISKGHLTERLARRHFQQLVSALCFCHQNGVAHRDIKPQNLLLDKDGNLKVSDFGLSSLSENLRDHLLSTACGTPVYTAPEILQRQSYNGSLTDAWSCGLILYIMLTGYLPFNDYNIPMMCRKISMRDYQYPKCISKSARQVIYNLLEPNPMKRMSLESLYEIPWFKKSMEPEIERSMLRLGWDSCEKSEAGLNAFEIISLSRGLDLGGLFEMRLDKMFTSNAEKNVVVEKVKEIGLGLGFKIEEGKNGLIGLGKGKVAIIVEVSEIVKDLLLVTMKVDEGGLNFENYWNDWKRGLENIVLSWLNEAP